MAKSGANAEPSMEEILASIRQIISDDAPESAADDVADDADDDDALELESAPDENISEADLDALFADPAPALPDEDDEPSGDIDEGFASVADDFGASSATDDDEDVLDLGAMAEGDEPFDPPEDLDFADPLPEPEPVRAPEPVAVKPAPRPVTSTPLPAPASLLSQEADSAVSAAFANLANTMLSGNARTLEDLVQDMLRPMLKSWLDENLPTMVEKLGREEIERVARRGPRP